jgi:hypothetical protein
MGHYLVIREHKFIGQSRGKPHMMREIVQAINPEFAVERSAIGGIELDREDVVYDIAVYELACDEHGDPVTYTYDDLDL